MTSSPPQERLEHRSQLVHGGPIERTRGFNLCAGLVSMHHADLEPAVHQGVFTVWRDSADVLHTTPPRVRKRRADRSGTGDMVGADGRTEHFRGGCGYFQPRQNLTFGPAP